MQESKSCALPLGYTPKSGTLELYHKKMPMSIAKEEKIEKSEKSVLFFDKQDKIRSCHVEFFHLDADAFSGNIG